MAASDFFKSSCFMAILAAGIFTAIPALGLAQTDSPCFSGAAASDTGFDIASIRPSQKDVDTWRLEFTADGFVARGVTLRDLIHEAFGIYEDDRLTGGPKWAATEKFDITARIDSTNVACMKAMSVGERRSMLLGTLRNRLHLKVREAEVVLPVYAIRLTKDGPKMRTSDKASLHPGGIQGVRGLVRKSSNGLLDVEDFSMKELSESLSDILGKTVADETGLPGYFNFILRWNSGDSHALDDTGDASPWPSLQTALREQLGLQLASTRTLISTIVIDAAEMPTPN